MSTDLKREADLLGSENVKKSKPEKLLRCGLTWCGQDNWHQNPKRGHPERPDRVGCIVKHLKECGLLNKCEHIEFSKWNDDDSTNSRVGPPLIEEADMKVTSFSGSAKLESRLEAVHSPYYLTRFSAKRFNKLASSDYGLDEEASQYDSIYLADKSADAARRAVAASLSLADALVDGRIANGFAVVRPPGHHAEPCAAKGFCLFNNVGVVAKHLSQVKNERVLIVDFDVHHGNGTAAMFNKVSNPCYMSLHRHDEGAFFPGASSSSSSPKSASPHPASALAVGEGEGVGHNVNIAWDGKGAGDMEYITAFQKVLIPIANSFEPTVVLVSAGFDAALGDPIGGCTVTPQGYGMITRMLCECIPSARGRVLLLLEGGYLLSVLPQCAKACVDVLIDQASKQPSSAAQVVNTVTHTATTDSQQYEDNIIKPLLHVGLNPLLAFSNNGRKQNSFEKDESHLESKHNDTDSETVSEAESGKLDDDVDDWENLLLPSAAQSIRDTIEAHRPHWPDVIF